jgi:RimJ/RimL family protein N-acetyltransferase
MQTPTLEGPGVRLEPLTLDHLPALEAIAFEPALSRYMVHPIRDPTELRAWADRALALEAQGTALPWVTIAKGQNGQPDQVVGGTRFLDLDMINRTTELGFTWLGAAWRGTRVNLEAKLLQLTFAFESLELNRVAFKTHSANQRSQAAIKAVGGVYEGTFRNHFIMADGSIRDSCWFSIIRSDWPDVKDMLTRRLHAPL